MHKDLHKDLHPRDSIDRLYVSRNKYCVDTWIQGLNDDIKKNKQGLNTVTSNIRTDRKTTKTKKQKWWFGLVTLFNGISKFAKAILVEE